MWVIYLSRIPYALNENQRLKLSYRLFDCIKLYNYDVIDSGVSLHIVELKLNNYLSINLKDAP